MLTCVQLKWERDLLAERESKEMEVWSCNVDGGGYRVERITRTDSHQFARERRGPPQRLRPTIINISSSVTHMNGTTFISVQNLSSSSASYHTIFVFLIPLLVGVIEINNVQDKNKSLIETHPMSMCSFLLALLIYSFAYFAAMKFKFQIFKAIAVMSGSICSVSLVSIILPRQYGHFSFIMWAFVLLFVGYSKRLHKKIWQFWKFRGINQQQLLPL